jgi:hypothetical protein
MFLSPDDEQNSQGFLALKKFQREKNLPQYESGVQYYTCFHIDYEFDEYQDVDEEFLTRKH